MGFNMWFIFASLLLVSVSANRYEQSQQQFYDVTFDPETAEQNENGEVILYLSPDQVKALEAEGASVRSAENPENDEADSEQAAEPQVNEEQEEDEQAENEEAQEEEAQQEEQENPENIQNQDLDFDEILRILNEEVEAEAEQAAEEQARNEPQVEEENTESPRNFSPRITLGQQQQQQLQQQDERYLAPLVKKEQILKSFSTIRYQPNDQRQSNVQLLQQQQELAELSSEKPQREALNQEKRKYKLIPYEVIETPAQEENAEEQTQNAEVQDDAQRLNDLNTPNNNADRFTGADQRRNRLQSILRELRTSSKYNDQKYAIEIERLRANAEKQIAASRPETIPKTVPTLVKQQLNKKNRLNKSKQGKGAASNAESQKSSLTKVQKSAPSANARAIGVPVNTAEKIEAQRPIPVPVEAGKRLSVRNVYVKARADKPYIVTRLSRRVPENRRNPAVFTNEPERITVLRHIWEN